MRRIVLSALSPVSFAFLLVTMLAAQSAVSQPSQAKTTAKTQARKKAPAAAPATPGQLSSIAVIRVKPEMINEWIDLNTNTVNPALKKAGVKSRSVWQTAQFGESFEYVVITPIESLAQFDGEPPLRKALGEQGYQAYLEKARRMITSVHTYADQERPELSYLGKMTGPPKLVVVADIQVAPGRTADFENLIKTDVLPAVKKGGALGYFVNQTILGGDISGYASVTVYENFADLAKGSPLIRGMGPAGYERFLRKTAGIVVRTQRSVYRFIPNLSFGE